jgi:hypothetical protein
MRLNTSNYHNVSFFFMVSDEKLVLKKQLRTIPQCIVLKNFWFYGISRGKSR